MVEMRQLTDDEKRLVRRNIQFIKEDLEFMEAVRKQIAVSLEVAPIMYRKQIKDIEGREKSNTMQIEEHKNAIKELERQIKDGVEVKNDKQTKS